MFCQPGKHSSFSAHLFRAGLRSLVKLASVCILGVFAALGAVTQRSLLPVVYVNDNTSANQIDAFYVNPNGTLQAVPGSPFLTGGNGGFTFDIDSIAIRPGESPFSGPSPFLYATNDGSANVSGFKINSDGSLTPVPGSPFADTGSFPVGVAVSADGRFLFVGLYDYAIDVFRINANGSLTLVPGSPFGIGNSDGYDVLFDHRRNNVISDINNTNQVGVLHLNSGTGMLTPIPGSPFTTSTSNNQKMGLRPQGDLLFVAGGGYDAVDVLKVAPDGSLSEVSQVPISDFVVGTTVHPYGGYVYFGAVSSANIYGYVVGAGGTLTPVSGSPFASGGEGPTGLTTDNLGLFLFAVNTFSDSVTSFGIQRNGALVLKGTVSLKGSGGYPSGIAFYGPPCPFCP